MALTDVPDDAYPLPERKDNVDGWHLRHQRAALLRAQDWTWADIASELGVAESTANQYTKIDGFDCLVVHLEAVVRQKRIEQSELETLEVILDYKPKVLEKLATIAIENGDAYAAAQFLEAIGFSERNRALAELEALGEANDSGGRDLNINAEIDS